MATTIDEQLAFTGPLELAELVRSRKVHPRELVEMCLRRIEALDPRLNAFRVTLADEALAAAESPAGATGPLAGVPIAIKDDYPVEGRRPRGARAATDRRPRRMPRRSSACGQPGRFRSGSPTSRS